MGNGTADATARTFRATFPMPAVGTRILTATASLRGPRSGDDRQVIVIEIIDREMTDLRARPDAMASIARASGGSAFSIRSNAPAGLGATLAKLPPPTEELLRTPLWDKLPWMLTALGLLAPSGSSAAGSGWLEQARKGTTASVFKKLSNPPISPIAGDLTHWLSQPQGSMAPAWLSSRRTPGPSV